jgi:hypothetical protein
MRLEKKQAVPQLKKSSYASDVMIDGLDGISDLGRREKARYSKSLKLIVEFRSCLAVQVVAKQQSRLDTHNNTKG